MDPHALLVSEQIIKHWRLHRTDRSTTFLRRGPDLIVELNVSEEENSTLLFNGAKRTILKPRRKLTKYTHSLRVLAGERLRR